MKRRKDKKIHTEGNYSLPISITKRWTDEDFKLLKNFLMGKRK